MVTFVLAALASFVLGTFVEYWGHRLMHRGQLLGKHHARHHQEGSGQGWLREFRDYAAPSTPFCLLGLLVSPALGWGLFSGGLAYAALAAYAHQAQHENPRLVWWLAQPVHAVHHYHREWHHNFGITVDFWDRVFKTYKAHEPLPEIGDPSVGPLSIHVLHRSPPLQRRPPRAARSERNRVA